MGNQAQELELWQVVSPPDYNRKQNKQDSIKVMYCLLYTSDAADD